MKQTLLVWVWNNLTDWLRIDQAGCDNLWKGSSGKSRLRVLRPFRAMSKKKNNNNNKQRKQNWCKQVAESYEKSRPYFSCASHPEVRAAILV